MNETLSHNATARALRTFILSGGFGVHGVKSLALEQLFLQDM